MNSVLQSNFKRVLLGLSFIAVGVAVGALAEGSPSIVRALCGDDPSVWCWPVRIALLDFGLKSISYTFIFLGVVLAILYTYVSELLGAILSFALNHVSNSKNVVVDAMERGTVSRDDSAEIVVKVLSRYMGYFDRNSESFSKFLVEKFMKQTDGDGGFWRRDYHAIIRVEEVPNIEGAVLSANYLRWSEVTSFSVENTNSGKVYPYQSQSSVEVFEEGDRENIISEFRYEVRAGGKLIFSFEDHKEHIKAHDLGAGPYKSDGLTVALSDGDISIKVEKRVVVDHGSIDFVVDEESLISKEDTTYELCLVEPTKRITFRFNLPAGFRIFHHGCSGRKFGQSVSDKVVLTQPGDNRVGLDVYDWCLPGIATVLAWKSSVD